MEGDGRGLFQGIILVFRNGLLAKSCNFKWIELAQYTV
jgi:hypothetical protein